MGTYNEKINEFTDWVDGHNLITNETGPTGGDPVIGGRIRELLQNRNMYPVYLYHNRERGKYQLFASEAAQKMYEAYAKTNKKAEALLLGEFDGPSAYQLDGFVSPQQEQYLTDISGDINPVTVTWRAINTSVDAVEKYPKVASEVVISIYNNGILLKQISDYIAPDAERVVIGSEGDLYYQYSADISQHLLPGRNTVTVIVKVPSFDLATPFDVYYNYIDFLFSESSFNPYIPFASSYIQVRPKIQLTIGASVRFHAYLDNVPLSSESGDPIGSDEEVRYPIDFELEEGMHVLTMFLSTSPGSNTFYSNVICKQFVKGFTDGAAHPEAILVGEFGFPNPTGLEDYKNGRYSFSLQQYTKLSFSWGLYNANPEASFNVKFYLSDSNDPQQDLTTVQEIGRFDSVYAQQKYGEDVKYKASELFVNKYLGYSASSTTGYGKTFKPLGKSGQSSTLTVTKYLYDAYVKEETGYYFKFDAYAKNNETDHIWEGTTTQQTIPPFLSNVSCTTYNVPFTENIGWYKDSFRTKGTSYMYIYNLPFVTNPNDPVDNQFAFEIDFITEFVCSDDDVLVDVGGFIKIFPNKAILYNANNQPIIETHYRTGERVHLTMAKYPDMADSSYSDLIIAVTNGIMERAKYGQDAIHGVNQDSSIKIGGAQYGSGIRVFNMRYYKNSVGWLANYNNWIYDSDDKTDLILRNMVYNEPGSGVELEQLYKINPSKCTSMMDMILVEGDLSELIGDKTGKPHMVVTSLERKCPTDSTKNFIIYDCYIRKHGQSNLAYPVPSFKIWTNKADNDSNPRLVQENVTQIYAKQRMQVYDGAIPANKWVLQSNFADSSCAHNGTFLRKWNLLTFYAQITEGTKSEYKLRTPPQLFVTGQQVTPRDLAYWQARAHNSSLTEAERLEAQFIIATQQGYTNVYAVKKGIVVKNTLEEFKQWADYAGVGDDGNPLPFPYDPIRQSANSFPTMMFYHAPNDSYYTFLGQYVFMDDKKSDFTYGERSIYMWPEDKLDPFVMKNSNVVQSDSNPDGTSPVKRDTEENRIWDNTKVVRIEVLQTDSNVVNFLDVPGDYWKVWTGDYESSIPNEDFELIYPDIDDLKTYDKIEAKFSLFRNFCVWMNSTANNFEKFKAEASQHLDLYSVAAYYLWVMMFGLTDSTNRNMQWKTYDGQHWRIEPWDMDVAMGRTNEGVIAYDPPMDRQTPNRSETAQSKAYSGENSVFWNNLEAWDEWKNTILPTVAQAMYNAGLKYNLMIEELDNYFSLKWPEYVYNKSGEFKYIFRGTDNNPRPDNSFISWLQGAGITYRHWWLSTSMDFWFAKLGCGSFTSNSVKIAGDLGAAYYRISVKPAQKGYFGYFLEDSNVEGVQAGFYDNGGLKDEVYWDFTNISFSVKKPFYLCGFADALELDVSDMGLALSSVDANADSGLQSLNVGSPIVIEDGVERLKYISATELKITDFWEHVANLQRINVTGQKAMQTFTLPTTITHFYAAASAFINGLEVTGNKFEELQLPNTHVDKSKRSTEDPSQYLTLRMSKLTFTDCSWQSLKFYDTDNDATATTETIPDPEDPGHAYEISYYRGNISEVSINMANPLNNGLCIQELKLLGKTCGVDNAHQSFDLVKAWVNSAYAQGLSDAEKKSKIRLEGIVWGGSSDPSDPWIVTFDDVVSLIPFYQKADAQAGLVPNMRGMITLDASQSQYMTPTNLAYLIESFGADVFTPGSGGLVVNYPLDATVISIDPRYADMVVDPETGQLEYYQIDETDITNTDTGMQIPISFVEFALSQDLPVTDWVLFAHPNEQSSEWNEMGQNLRRVGHPNIEIIGIQDVEADNAFRYYLIVKESANIGSQDYVFRLAVKEAGDTPEETLARSVEIHVTPVVYHTELELSNQSIYVALKEPEIPDDPLILLFRTVDSRAIVNVNLSGTTAKTPQSSWGIKGNASLVMNLEERTNPSMPLPRPENNQAIVEVSIQASALEQLDPSNGVGELQCRLKFSQETIIPTYSILLKNDPLVLTSSEEPQLFNIVRAALGLSGVTELYASDIASVTSLTLSNTDYTTHVEIGDTAQYYPIFKYLTNCQNLTINETGVFVGGLTQEMLDDYFRTQYMPALKSLTIIGTQNRTVHITPMTVLTSFTTTSSNVGVQCEYKAVKTTITLDAPKSIKLLSASCNITVGSKANMRDIYIDDDSGVLYVNNPARWMGWIPAQQQMASLCIKNIDPSDRKEVQVSLNQAELANLITQAFENQSVEPSGTMSQAWCYFDNLPSNSVKVNGYYKTYANRLPVDLYDACDFNSDYYVLYNDSEDSTYTLCTAVTQWVNTPSVYPHTISQSFCDPTLGWSSKALAAFSVVGSTQEESVLTLTLSGITSVKASVIKIKGTASVTENILNEYLKGYKVINLSGPSGGYTPDPELVAMVSGIRVNLDNPQSVSVNAGDYSNVQVIVNNKSNITYVNIHKIYKPFSTVFGWNRTTSLTTGSVIEGQEPSGGNQMTSAEAETIQKGLTESINMAANLTLKGVISAYDVIYVSQEVYDMYVGGTSAHPTPLFSELTVQLSIAYVPDDPVMQSIFEALGIVKTSQLNQYSWKTFWRAYYEYLYGEDPSTASAAFLQAGNTVRFAPESQYMTASYLRGDHPLTLDISGSWTKSGVTYTCGQPNFNTLEFLVMGQGAALGNGNNNNNFDLPSGCYQKMFKESWTSSQAMTGVFIVNGSVSYQKYNGGLINNFILVINGSLSTNSSDAGIPRNKWLACESVGNGSNVTHLVTNLKNTLSTDDTVSTAFYKMYRNTNSSTGNKYLEDWFTQDYVYNKGDF